MVNSDIAILDTEDKITIHEMLKMWSHIGLLQTFIVKT